jgi:hypothetical protein
MPASKVSPTGIFAAGGRWLGAGRSWAGNPLTGAHRTNAVVPGRTVGPAPVRWSPTSLLPYQQRVICRAMLLALVGVGGLRLAIE